MNSIMKDYLFFLLEEKEKMENSLTCWYRGKTTK